MSEMRQLLQKWAEIEPGRCEKSGKNIFTIQTAPDPMEAEAKNIYDPDNLSGLDLAWIQWVVQQAIIARGWRWNLECYPVTGICEGIVFFGSTHIRQREGGPAEALLSAYLETLEAQR
jgi:hypothetical protein